MGTQLNLNTEAVGSIRVAMPPRAEQEAIVGFLDRKTAAIDELIKKKERLIELLQEKRQALITQAVTKGLDAKVPMKESGVPAIGRIPNHWEVRRLGRISPSLTVGVVVNPSRYCSDSGAPFLFGGNVYEGGFDLDGVRCIGVESSRALKKSMLNAGDLVTVRVGYPGVTAVIPPELGGSNCASMMIIRRSPSFSSDWLCLAMNSRVGRQQVEAVQYGAAQEQFNIGHAVNFAFPFPPLGEQNQIADHLLVRVRLLAATAEGIGLQIVRIREYRQALVSAAITGQLDLSKETA